MDDLWDGGEGGAVLPQHVTAVCGLAELHVHEALAAPGRGKEERYHNSFPARDDRSSVYT